MHLEEAPGAQRAACSVLFIVVCMFECLLYNCRMYCVLRLLLLSLSLSVLISLSCLLCVGAPRATTVGWHYYCLTLAV